MKKLFFIFIFISLVTLSLDAQNEHQFIGHHLISTYMDCDQDAINDEVTLKEKMKEAVQASGFTILDSSDYHFEPHGMTQTLLLSESHASIHTYPEYQSCFVDLFTCGTVLAMDQFDKILSDYLKPGKVSHKLFVRQESCDEIAYTPLP